MLKENFWEWTLSETQIIGKKDVPSLWLSYNPLTISDPIITSPHLPDLRINNPPVISNELFLSIHLQPQFQQQEAVIAW